MTVCISAICSFNGVPMIVGAADRMITHTDADGPATDIEYEHGKPKIFSLAPACIALIADDLALGADLCHRARDEILRTRERLERERDPSLGIPFTEIKLMAEVYARVLREYRDAQSEREILNTLFLTRETWISRQRQLAPAVVRAISNDLREFSVPVQAIIAGVDNLGAHIYAINGGGSLTCEDAIGYAAIGNGGWHADSEFMVARYSDSWSFDRAVLLVYTAKKRAERASGVGPATDTFIVMGGAYTPLNPTIVDAVHNAWNDMQDVEKLTKDSYYENISRIILGYLKDSETNKADQKNADE